MRNNQTHAGGEGFTLVELLIAIGIIGILVSVVLVAINPSKQLNDARNAERAVHVNQLEKATMQYVLSTTHEPVAGIPTGAANAAKICRAGIAVSGCVNVDTLVPTTVVAIPLDPTETDTNVTGYRIYKDQSSRIHVCSDYLPTANAAHCPAGASAQGSVIPSIPPGGGGTEPVEGDSMPMGGTGGDGINYSAP
jgi:type IV pilus assembly protein PilA